MSRLSVNFASLLLSTFLGLQIQLWNTFPIVSVKAMAFPASPSRRRSSVKNKLVIIGLGRVGLQAANLAIEKKGVQVLGTVRQPSKQKRGTDCFNDKKIALIPFDPIAVREHLFGCQDDQTKDDFATVAASHVLFTIPLSRKDDPVLKAVLKEVREWWNIKEEDGGYANEMKSDNCCHSKVLGILSTTGVYGNHNGETVTESSPLLCEENSNAALYRQFEAYWISSTVGDLVEDDDRVRSYNEADSNRRLRIFRCAGIYDSSRSALHTLYKSFQSGTQAYTPVTSSSSIPNTANKTNRIHSMDLARGVMSGMFQEVDNEGSKLKSAQVRIYNLADSLPESRSVVLSYAQGLLASIGIDQRTFRADGKAIDTTERSNILSRSSITRQRRREKESKLVCNKRMREELLPDDGLLFPTYKEGLCAIFNDPITPWQQQQIQS